MKNKSVKQKTNQSTFTTKHSGKVKKYGNGFVRDSDEAKPRYDLIPTDMLKRLAELYTRGARIYGDRKQAGGNDVECFKRSAWRHFVQWQNGEDDEDHGSAVVFNIFAYNHLKQNGQN